MFKKKLMLMLDAEESYTESQWQEELLQIILLLYPKYIYLFKEVPVRDTYSNKDRRIDYLLVDSSGNTDIIEIKKSSFVSRYEDKILLILAEATRLLLLQ
jgi:hypothetical protein